MINRFLCFIGSHDWQPIKPARLVGKQDLQTREFKVLSTIKRSQCTRCKAILNVAPKELVTDYTWIEHSTPTDEVVAPVETLVERVLQRMFNTPSPSPLTISPNQVRAAILEVSAAALQMHPDNNLTWERVALWLEQEANL